MNRTQEGSSCARDPPRAGVSFLGPRRSYSWRPLMMACLQRGSGVRGLWVGAAIIVSMFGPAAWGQLPGLPAVPTPAKSAASGKASPGAAQEKPKAAVEKPKAAAEKPKAAAAEGPITVHRQVKDEEIQRFLARFLPKY